MPNSLIEERDERTRKRKKIKKKFDSIIGLSYHDDNHEVMSLSVDGKITNSIARLLDEGYCDNGFVLKKGTLEKFLNGKNEKVRGWRLGDNGWKRTDVLNLSGDFTGTVNLGHMDFATFPIILGEWTRNDMSLVDIENGRKALDIKLKLDEESVFVKELRRQKHDIGVSAEFWYHVNVEDTEELAQTLGEYLPVIDEIFIFAYGLVGECGNVNSSGLELTIGEINMPNEILETVVDETVDNEEIVLDADIDEPIDAPVEDAIDEVDEPTEDETADAENGEEVETEEVADETGDDEGADDEAEADEDELEQAMSIITELREQIATLTATIEELKKSNRRLTSKLKAEKDKKSKFLANAKGLAVELLPNEGEEPKEEISQESVAMRKYLNGDGIGED